MELHSLEKINVTAANHSTEDAERILATAINVFNTWKDVSFEQRSKLMNSVADALDRDKEKYARLITEEMGKVIQQSRKEIEKCAITCRFYSEKASEFLKPELIKSSSAKSYISYHPLGPILAVMPWNFPFWQVIRFAAPALMAGNTAILKHASNVPKCAMAIERLFIEAGFPKGAFQTLLIEGKNMDSIVKDPRIKAVTLTGSEEAGSKVAEAAGKSLKKSVLELGGSDPFIVLEDADLNLATEIGLKSRMVNTGQSCIAAKRFILVEGIADDFIKLFKEKMSRLKAGDPLKEDSDYGPLAKVEFATVLDEQIKKSVKLGARVIFGGEWNEDKKAYFPATILTNVKHGMPAYEDELFGPVASMITVKDEEEAVKVANDTRFGLGASIWTKSISKAEILASKIDAGTVSINKMVASDPQMPFGGIKMSGYGRELSYLGIREFTNIKTVNIA